MSLVTEMLRNPDIARFVASLLPIAMKDGYSHRVLVAFNAACLHDFLLRSSQLDEGTVAYLLPALLEPLQQVPVNRDAVVRRCYVYFRYGLRSASFSYSWDHTSSFLLSPKDVKLLQLL